MVDGLTGVIRRELLSGLKGGNDDDALLGGSWKKENHEKPGDPRVPL